MNPQRIRVSLSSPIDVNALTNIANQTIEYTDTPGLSSVVSGSTTQVVVTLTTNGHIAIGNSPIASVTTLFLPAYTPSLPIQVTGGISRISGVRADYCNGTMYIAEYE